MRRLFVLFTLIAAAQSVSLRGGAAPDVRRWWSHIEALANDGMEGRDTGSAAHKRAAEHVATQFQKTGLEPAGTDGYVQPVTFKTRRIVDAQSRLALVRNGTAEPLTLGDDANFSMPIEPAPSVEARLVFIGYGPSIPELPDRPTWNESCFFRRFAPIS